MIVIDTVWLYSVFHKWVRSKHQKHNEDICTLAIFYSSTICLHYATNRNVAGSIPDGVIGINSLT
jgi:hypothetical protein